MKAGGTWQHQRLSELQQEEIAAPPCSGGNYIRGVGVGGVSGPGGGLSPAGGLLLSLTALTSRYRMGNDLEEILMYLGKVWVMHLHKALRFTLTLRHDLKSLGLIL